MGFLHHVAKAVKHVAKEVEHTVTHPQDTIKTAVHGVSKIGHGLDDMAHGHFKEGFGEVAGGIKNVADPAHVIGMAHELTRPITNPINKALADGIKDLTGHNVLGSHPLNTIGTVVASVFTGGAAAALAGGATLAGSLAAGISTLESAAGSVVGAVGTGLSDVGLTTAGSAVSGWSGALDAAAHASMAASGSIAGQMGLAGSQAAEMNIGSGLTNAGQAAGNNIIGKALTSVGDKLTGAVSDELAAGTGHAMGSFGFATAKDGTTQFVQGTANEVTKAGVKFGGSSSWADTVNNVMKAKSVANGLQQKATQSQQGGDSGPDYSGADAGWMQLQEAKSGNILDSGSLKGKSGTDLSLNVQQFKPVDLNQSPTSGSNDFNTVQFTAF